MSVRLADHRPATIKRMAASMMNSLWSRLNLIILFNILFFLLDVIYTGLKCDGVEVKMQLLQFVGNVPYLHLNIVVVVGFEQVLL